ncbi:MAG: hypothetical protein GY793_03155 [Proteobacteria bacterium]|nr:hypothetical protein [Pseudomonadota bacterium]
MNLKNITFTWTKTTTLSYIFAFVMIFAGVYILPVHFFDENGPIESLEIATLTIGATLGFLEYKKNHKYSNVFLTIGLLLTLFIGRELSWGRVFFTDEAGEIIRSGDWKYKLYARYALGIYLVTMLTHAIKTKFITTGFNLFKKCPIVAFDFLLMALMAVMSIIGEKYYSVVLPKNLHYLHFAIEESAEVVMYFAASLVIYYYAKQARN